MHLHNLSLVLLISVEELSTTLATIAMVFMLCSLKGHWKVPVAYFLTAGTDVSQLSQCIQEAIVEAAELGL